MQNGKESMEVLVKAYKPCAYLIAKLKSFNYS